MTPAPLLSLVVPARNESGTIVRSVQRLQGALAELGVSWEILVSDSGSTDDTAALVASLGHAQVRVVHNPLPGKGRAIASGIAGARGAYVGFIDADLEIDPGFIRPLLAEVERGADFAIAVKTLPDARRAPHRRLATFCYNALIRRLLGTPFSDHQAGLKLFRAAAIAPLLPLLRSEGWFWDTEMLFALHRSGACGSEVPVRTVRHRSSQVGFFRVSLELVVSAVRLRLARAHPRRRASVAPTAVATE